jgi:hypothetical protein
MKDAAFSEQGEDAMKVRCDRIINILKRDRAS